MSNTDSQETLNPGQEKVKRPLANRKNGSSHRSFRQRLAQVSAYKRLSFVAKYVRSYYRGRQNHELFQQIKTYCLFIGHARSGHTVVGAVLDAHPNAVIADEVDTLRYVAAGFSWDQICHILLTEAQRLQADKERKKRGREGKTYSYLVPDQWQGRFDKLHVIGDTRAGGSTIRIGEDPTILQRLQDATPTGDVRMIHVVRNPYDNIATKMVRKELSFERSIGDYFRNCQIIRDLQERSDTHNILLVKQEDFINQSEATIERMCHFLGLEASPEYVNSCASILYKSPAKSRHKVPWTSELLDSVQERIGEFDFLEGYSFDS